MDVYIAFNNSMDWSDGRPRFAGIGLSVEAALGRLDISDEHRQKWLDGDAELRGYFSIWRYNAETGKRIMVM